MIPVRFHMKNSRFVQLCCILLICVEGSDRSGLQHDCTKLLEFATSKQRFPLSRNANFKEIIFDYDVIMASPTLFMTPERQSICQV